IIPRALVTPSSSAFPPLDPPQRARLAARQGEPGKGKAMRALFAGVAAMLCVACAPLTAERPLFSVLDQTGPAPLTEGAWVQGWCAPEAASASPEACVRIELQRASDGAWLYTMRSET